MTENEKTAIRIARQSQLERSLEFFQQRGIKPTLKDWVNTADVLTRYVIDGRTKDNLELLERADEYLNKEY